MYIKELLLVHDCVIIPQFGGFVCNYKSAYYNKDTGRFYPPSKEINFNSKLTHNDGLLCQQIMKAKGLSFNEAYELIQNEVQETNLQLERNSIVIDGLGEFKLNESGYTVFNVEKDTKYLKGSYGLASFVFPELKREENSNQLRVVKSEKNSLKSISRYVAVSAAAIALFFFLFPATVTNVRLNEANIISSFDSLNKEIENTEPKALITEITEVSTQLENLTETSPKNIETVDESIAEINTQVIAPKVNQDIKSRVQVVSATQYHIIIASLATKEQAEAFVNKHCVDVFPEYSIIQSNGRYRVSINALTDRSIAIPVLETFRDTNPEFSDAWLLTIKATV